MLTFDRQSTELITGTERKIQGLLWNIIKENEKTALIFNV